MHFPRGLSALLLLQLASSQVTLAPNDDYVHPQSCITSVPAVAPFKPRDVFFSNVTTILRLQLATSYAQTAAKLAHLGDKSKTIACYVTARAWLRGCIDDNPPRGN